MQDRIVQINSTKYLVKTKDGYVNAIVKGIFRKEKISPLVGDIVDLDNEHRISKIYERKNFLTRPNIANVDIALIITSVKKPDLDLVLLDKLLVNIINNNIEPVICFTKVDLLEKKEIIEYKKIKKYYESLDIKVLENTEISYFKKIAKGKIIVCCGQTGAGKSTFINKLDNRLKLETKPISETLNRGVHTTRYVSLYEIEDFFLADTPGFSALDLHNFTKEQIRDAFLEFANSGCKYQDCMHIHTEGCLIEPEVGKKILPSRYENYKKFIKEINESSSKLFK